MPEVVWTATSEYAFVDDKGRPGLVGVFDRFRAFDTPGYTSIFVVSRVAGLVPGTRAVPGVCEFHAGAATVKVPFAPLNRPVGQSGVAYVLAGIGGVPVRQTADLTIRIMVEGAPPYDISLPLAREDNA